MCTINDKFGHNYINGTCLDCGRSQKPVHKIELPKIDFKARKKESSNSKIQLCTDIIKELGGTYGFYMKIINLCGEQNVRCWLSDSRQSAIPIKKFKWYYSEYYKKIKWDNKKVEI